MQHFFGEFRYCTLDATGVFKTRDDLEIISLIGDYKKYCRAYFRLEQFYLFLKDAQIMTFLVSKTVRPSVVVWIARSVYP